MKSRKVPRKVGVKSPAGKSGNQDPRGTGPALEEIRLRAYEIYIERGGTDGRDLDDWLQAEKEFAENTRKRRSE
jgi:Protein of unknown function (DUF2934)